MKGRRPEIWPALRTKFAWCSWGVQFSFLLQSGCDVLDAAGTESWATFRMPGHSQAFPLCLPLWLPERLSTHPSLLSFPLVSREWNSNGIPRSWLSYYPPSSVEVTLALRAVKLVVLEPLNCICNSSGPRCFSVWTHINHSDLEDRVKCLQQPLYRLY